MVVYHAPALQVIPSDTMGSPVVEVVLQQLVLEILVPGRPATAVQGSI